MVHTTKGHNILVQEFKLNHAMPSFVCVCVCVCVCVRACVQTSQLGTLGVGVAVRVGKSPGCIYSKEYLVLEVD